MNRFIASLVGCFFFCMATVFASTDSANTPNWTDLLLKSVNFFIFFGLLWFFFRKKIVAALRGIAQGEYKLFFSALNKKKQLEEELKSIYQKLNQKKEEIEERKKSYQDEVEEEKKTMELEMEKYLKKMEQNQQAAMLQEYKESKQVVYKKILNLSLEKFEKQLKNKTITVNEDKYFSRFISNLKPQN